MIIDTKFDRLKILLTKGSLQRDLDEFILIREIHI